MPDTDTDQNTTADSDPSTLLGVVSPPEPPEAPSYDEAIRAALTAIQAELVRLRTQRRDDDREGLAEIARMKRDLIDKRKVTNGEIADALIEQKRLTALVRVLDKQ